MQFAQEIVKTLEDAKHQVWFDQKDDSIRPSALWWDEIRSGILRADVFVALVSQNSAGSAMCQLEIDHAKRHHKKIVTVICGQFKNIDFQKAGGKLAAEETQDYVVSRIEGRELTDVAEQNWHFLSDTQGMEFTTPAVYLERSTRLLKAIDTDLDYANYHTWLEGGRKPSRTLRGDVLSTAESWLGNVNNALKSGASPKANPPTDEQEEFVQASRQNERIRQRRWISALTVGIVIAVKLALLSFALSQVANANALRVDNNAATAVRRADESNSLALVANAQIDGANDQQLALALAVEANRINNPPPLAQSVLSEFAYSGGNLLARLGGHTSYVSAVAFSPDEKMAATGSYKGELRLWDVQTHQPIRELKGHQFGGGPRLCLGQNFAMLEMRLMLALLAHNYQWELMPNQDLTPRVFPTPTPKGGIQVRFAQLTN